MLIHRFNLPSFFQEVLQSNRAPDVQQVEAAWLSSHITIAAGGMIPIFSIKQEGA